MKKNILLTALMILLITQISCKETKEVINSVNETSLVGDYLVTSIEGQKITSKNVTLNFNDEAKTVSGNAGCNTFSSTYATATNALNVGMVKSTMMYCEEAVMKTEQSFIKALKKTGSYTIKNNVLTLHSKENRSPILTAKKAN